MGYYLVQEWINPIIGDRLRRNESLEAGDVLVGAFPMRDFMITQSHLRTSKEMSDIYRRMYIRNQGWRFDGLVDLQAFSFDYDYEMYYGPDRSPQSLDDEGSNLPQYLLDLREEVQETYDVLNVELNRTLEDMLNASFSQLHVARPWLRTLSANDLGTLRLNLTDYFGSFIFNNSFVHVRHPISQHSGNYSIRMRLSQNPGCLRNITDLLRAHNASEAAIGELEGRGLQVQTLNVQQHHGHCRDCPPERQMLLDLGADLLDTNRSVWKLLRILQLGSSAVLVEARASDGAGQLDSLTACASKSIEFVVEERLKHREAPIEAKYFRGA
jgi:hypothetical protein